ncbi:MAG: hypothetical protein M3N95_18530 [Actinomycetota bacterium]|nr:hypothetical protein [Actinomycetota bacterium]
MSPAANPIARRAIVATILLVAGLGLAAVYRVLSGTEHQSFSAGAMPPPSSHVSAGKTYELAVPGGVATLKRNSANVATTQCEWSLPGSPSQVLAATASGTDTKAVNVVATFVAPVTGDIRVDCSGWGAMYIDDADNTPADIAGWSLLLAVIALALGAGLGVSALWMASEDPARPLRRTLSDDDEIERLVHVVHVRSQDGEVVGDDRGDI